MSLTHSTATQSTTFQSFYPFGEKVDDIPIAKYIVLFVKNFSLTIFSQLKSFFTGLYHNNKTLKNSLMVTPIEFSEGTLYKLKNSLDNVNAYLMKFHKKTGSTPIKELAKTVKAAIGKLKEDDTKNNTLYIPIGHSMGGMVAKFTAKETGKENCFVQINSPNFGSAPLCLFKYNKSSVFSQNFHPHGEIAQESRQKPSARLQFLSTYDALLPLTKSQKEEVSNQENVHLLETAHSAVLADKKSLEIITTKIQETFKIDSLHNGKTKIAFIFIHGLNANPGQMYPLAKKVIEKY